MGWETRRGNLYYYRKKRVNGRVRSIYCGGGTAGMLAARDDRERRSRAALMKAIGVKKMPVVEPPKLSDYLFHSPNIKVSVDQSDASLEWKARQFLREHSLTLYHGQRVTNDSLDFMKNRARSVKEEHPYVYVPWLDDA